MSSREWGEWIGLTLYYGVVVAVVVNACASALILALPGRTAEFGRAVARGITALNRTIGRAFAWLLLLMSLLVAITVAGAFVYGQGATSLAEGALFAHGALFLLAAPLALADDDHVRVDVFQRGFGPRARAAVDLAGSLLLLSPLCIMIAWFAYDYLIPSWAVAERSAETGGLPGVFLLKTLIPVFAFLMALQGAAQSLDAAANLARRGPNGDGAR